MRRIVFQCRRHAAAPALPRALDPGCLTSHRPVTHNMSPLSDFWRVSMHRRAFIRLVGGGVVAAATLPLAACDSGYPAEALAAWQGPGNEPDLRRWILGHAILAPHSHNLQSWLVDLRTPGEILLRCDLHAPAARDRPVLAPDHDEPRHLHRAARPRRARARPARRDHAVSRRRIRAGQARTRARWRASGSSPTPRVSKDPLFAQILKRHTNRNAYDPQRAR